MLVKLVTVPAAGLQMKPLLAGQQYLPSWSLIDTQLCLLIRDSFSTTACQLKQEHEG